MINNMLKNILLLVLEQVLDALLIMNIYSILLANMIQYIDKCQIGVDAGLEETSQCTKSHTTYVQISQ